MKKVTILLLLIVFTIGVFAQSKEDVTHDPEVRKILDQVSESFKNYETIRMYFEYTAINKNDSTKDVYNGYLFTKGEDKYKLIIPGSETFSDGIKVWQYNKKVAEINVTFSDPNNKALITPHTLLSVYKEGFKYSLKAEVEFDVKTKKDGKIVKEKTKMYMIDLYPEDVSKSPYSIIRLWINKEKTKIISVKYFGKDEFDYIIDIIEFSPNVIMNDKIFMYEKANYPKDVELIDFTEE